MRAKANPTVYCNQNPDRSEQDAFVLVSSLLLRGQLESQNITYSFGSVDICLCEYANTVSCGLGHMSSHISGGMLRCALSWRKSLRPSTKKSSSKHLLTALDSDC